MRENLKPMLGKVITVEGTFVNVKKKAGEKDTGTKRRNCIQKHGSAGIPKLYRNYHADEAPPELLMPEVRTRS